MALVRDVTLRDWFWRKRKRENPHKSLLSNVPGFHIEPERTTHQLPHHGLTTDPLLDWGKAQEAFHSWQVSEGREIFSNGHGINTAADEQNVRAARDEVHNTTHDVIPAPASPTPPVKPDNVLRYREPWNNPFSTVPGGLGFGPMKPPGM